MYNNERGKRDGGRVGGEGKRKKKGRSNTGRSTGIDRCISNVYKGSITKPSIGYNNAYILEYTVIPPFFAVEVFLDGTHPKIWPMVFPS